MSNLPVKGRRNMIVTVCFFAEYNLTMGGGDMEKTATEAFAEFRENH